VATTLPDEMPPRWLDQIRDLIEASKDETRSLIETSKDETRSLIETSKDELRSLIEASASETRRHFDVVAETLRSDIRAIAEGHAMLKDKLDGFQAEVRREFRRVDRRLLRLEARR